MSSPLVNDTVEKIAGLLENLVDLAGRYHRILTDDDYLINMSNNLDCSYNEIVAKFNRNFSYNNEDILTIIRFMQSADLEIQGCSDLLKKLLVPVEDKNFLKDKEYAKKLSDHLNFNSINLIREGLTSMLTPYVDKRMVDKLTFSGAIAC